MPISLASQSPKMSASYSATLLEAAKWICSVYFNLLPLGVVTTMPAPRPVHIFKPSKCIYHCMESGAGGRYWDSAQSTRKSANACDLMAVQG